MVKVHLVFKGETMAEVRSEMVAWADEFLAAQWREQMDRAPAETVAEALGSNAHAGVQGVPPKESNHPMPPKTRSYKRRKVENPVPAEETPAPTPAAPVGSVQGLLDPKPTEEPERNDDAVTAAAIRFAEKYGKPALKTLLVEQFQVTRARDIEVGKQVAFITACARGPR